MTSLQSKLSKVSVSSHGEGWWKGHRMRFYAERPGNLTFVKEKLSTIIYTALYYMSLIILISKAWSNAISFFNSLISCSTRKCFISYRLYQNLKQRLCLWVFLNSKWTLNGAWWNTSYIYIWFILIYKKIEETPHKSYTRDLGVHHVQG